MGGLSSSSPRQPYGIKDLCNRSHHIMPGAGWNLAFLFSKEHHHFQIFFLPPLDGKAQISKFTIDLDLKEICLGNISMASDPSYPFHFDEVEGFCSSMSC